MKIIILKCSNSDEEDYYKKCINLFLENSCDFKVPFFQNIKNFLRMGSFYLLSSEN